MEEKIGLFFGSDTGITEEITTKIINKWSIGMIDKHNIADCSAKDFDAYNYIFLGLSTWYYGELQSDWEDFFEEFKTIDFTGKTVCLYGPGDQYGYDHYFVDGIGILAEVVVENGGNIIGHFPSKGFEHEESKAQVNDNYFYGLALDDDNEPEKTDERINQWIGILESEWPK